jgi:hypothetical protein
VRVAGKTVLARTPAEEHKSATKVNFMLFIRNINTVSLDEQVAHTINKKTLDEGYNPALPCVGRPAC